MIRTDGELQRWWAGLAKSAQDELLDTIEEKATADAVHTQLAKIRSKLTAKQVLDYQELLLLSKWYRV